MEETFEIFEHRTEWYTINYWIQLSAYFVFICFFLLSFTSSPPDSLMAFLFLFGIMLGIIACVIGLSSKKTYISTGQLTLSDSSIAVNETTYKLNDLLSVETFAGDYDGRRLSDGSNNRIIIVTKNQMAIELKFVVVSKTQKDNLAMILKLWRAKGFKIVSNGIDLV